VIDHPSNPETVGLRGKLYVFIFKVIIYLWNFRQLQKQGNMESGSNECEVEESR
jgi:hypothetical protein